MVPPNQVNPTEGGNEMKPQQTPAPKTASAFQPPPPPKKSSTNPLLPIALTVGFLLLVAVGWLTYNSISTTRALEQKVVELEEAEKLRAELENQYNKALAELESMKGQNEQINALIDQQKAELEIQKNKIAALLRDKKQLDAAWAEINNLKVKVADYIAEIEQLKSQQELLTEENLTLKDEKEQLNVSLQSKISENETLQSAKAQLVSEKEDLSKAVQVGSVVKVKDIKVTGVKVRKSGKTAEKSNAKRVDQLKVCFTTVANEVVQSGTEKFFIRIINPKGETLAIDDLGSGVTVNSKTGEEVRYTQVAEYEYVNDETQLCFVWSPNTPFQGGKYNVEIYNKGHLAGAGEFELK
jgi:regulator of replication initiation timing